MNKKNQQTALITGASSGIGEAFAHELAKKGTKVILTARTEEKLLLLAKDIEARYGVSTLVLAEDLSQAGGAEKLYMRITEKGWSVDVLINNAGFGKWAPFLEEDLVTYQDMIGLNIQSLVTLTYLALPGMLQRGQGSIINVASTGSFQPCPYIATYCATKAFVLSFSEALYGEYYKKGIVITALCPGNTQTSFQSVANADTKGMRADTPERVAKSGLSALGAGKSYVVTGIDNYLTSLLPRFLTRKAVIGLVGNMMSKKVNSSHNSYTAKIVKQL